MGFLALLAACGGNVVVDSGSGAATGTGGSTTGGGGATAQSGSSGGATSTGAGGEGGAGCPEPHPQPCGAIEACPCTDGTTQVGGCANGFDCEQACCGHGGPSTNP